MSKQAVLGEISKKPDSSNERSKSENSKIEWESKKILDVFNCIKSGGTPKRGKEKYWKDGNIPFVKIEDLNKQQGKGISDAEEYTTQKAIEDGKTRSFDPGTILLTIYGTIGETGIVTESVSTNQGIIGLWDPVNTNIQFARYALDFEQDELASKKRETTQANIGKNILKLHEIPHPPLPEQRKIASVLYNVDQAIQKTEEIIEQTQRVKKGVMQDLFTEGYYDHEEFEEHPTLGKYPANWEIKQVEEIGKVNPDSFSAEGYDEDTFDYITLSNVSEGQILQIEEIQTDEAPSRAKRKVKVGDVLIGTVRPKQRSHAKIPEEHNDKVCSTGFTVIRPEDMNPDYLSQEIFTHRFFSQMQAYVAGSGYPAVKNSDVKKIKIAIPPKEEQEKIARTLQNYDNKLGNLQEEKKQLQRLKKGLMQDLLTGEVRTKDKDIEVLDEVMEVENQ